MKELPKSKHYIIMTTACERADRPSHGNEGYEQYLECESR
jgi:hypothetical protein